MEIRIHKILYDTTAEGFGHRACIWVQGCSRHCPGCMSEHTWNPKGGSSQETEDIISEILRHTDLEGVTLLGGEPFEQAQALCEIAKACKRNGLSVIAFSGYTLQELRAKGKQEKDVRELLLQIDLLIDGPYRRELRDFSRPLAGSSNQRFCFLTDRYKEEDVECMGNRLEIRISKAGGIVINGMGDFELSVG